MRRRTIKKNFWFNFEENRQLEYLSEISNLSESSVIRKLLFETEIKENAPKEFYEAIDKINKIGVNINQLAHVANATGNIYEEQLKIVLENLNQTISSLREKYL